jgi:hypothetical protein
VRPGPGPGPGAAAAAAAAGALRTALGAAYARANSRSLPAPTPRARPRSASPGCWAAFVAAASDAAAAAFALSAAFFLLEASSSLSVVVGRPTLACVSSPARALVTQLHSSCKYGRAEGSCRTRTDSSNLAMQWLWTCGRGADAESQSNPPL